LAFKQLENDHSWAARGLFFREHLSSPMLLECDRKYRRSAVDRKRRNKTKEEATNRVSPCFTANRVWKEVTGEEKIS
jgi:hypothetical protein